MTTQIGRNPKPFIRQFDVIDEETKKNDELSSVELQRILLARCNITVSARTIRVLDLNGTRSRILNRTQFRVFIRTRSCSERAPARQKFWRSFGVPAAFYFAFHFRSSNVFPFRLLLSGAVT